MDDRPIIFLGGLHKSGTSLVHKILRSHRQVSGISGTSAPRNEGQHLQSVYPTAQDFGGPGRFGFDEASFMDETHPLATEESALRLFAEWGRHWNNERKFLIEKSPPNLVRTRFLQRLFPGAMFVILLRHPIAVSYATRKWCKTSIASLVEHWFRCYERFRQDLPRLERVYVLRYEEFVAAPTEMLRDVGGWLGLAPFDAAKKVEGVKPDVNGKYFARWEQDRTGPASDEIREVAKRFASRAAAFGYRMDRPEELIRIDWLGPVRKKAG